MAKKPTYEEWEQRAKELEREAIKRKQAEEKIRSYQLMVESAHDAIFLKDLKSRYVIANVKTLEAFGLSKEKVIGKNDFEIMPSKEEAKKNIEDDQFVFATGKPTEITKLMTDIDGKEYWFQAIKVPQFDDKGNIIGLVGIARDVTDQKHAEEEKRTLEGQLLQAQKLEAIGTLAGGIAHDFNNVLMAIQGYASLMLLHIDSDHPHYQHIKGIEDSVQSAAALTKQLLGFARRGIYDVKPTNVNNLIHKSSEMFGRTRKEIDIHTKCQEDTWPVEVDRSQIEQVLLNLYVNAWHAMPRGGGLYVETTNVVLDEGYTKPFNLEPGNYVKMSVTDSGEGMDEATQQKMFDPFFTTREMSRGTGLGLASAYGIIKSHAGIITVDSKKGQGTTFDIYLPASGKDVVTEEKKLADEISKGTETVLIVDDEHRVLDVGKKMLEGMGYKVLIARSGKEAIEVHKKHRDEIDLVILDMVMPGMGGGETYDRMKAMDRSLKVLLASGYSINGEASEILKRGGDGFIQKPFNITELSRRIREVFDKK